MDCPRCGSSLTGIVRFCLQCGVELSGNCPGCGAVAAVSQKFCSSCGTALHSKSQTRLTPPAPETIAPVYLAERISKARGIGDGQLKFVSVLFADIVGSTALIDGLEPEEAIALLRPALSTMIEAVHLYEGTVNRLLGDGIMALFGAPIAHEDHAIRACYSAIEMQERIRKISDDIDIRVGVHSGSVMVYYVKNDLSVDYDAIGPTVHLASRMEELAEPGGILITFETNKLVRGYVGTAFKGEQTVKGVSGPVGTYLIKSRIGGRSRWATRMSFGLNPMIGRSAEMRRIAALVEATLGGKGRMIAIAGDAGIGKSRLVHEAIHSGYLEGWSILETFAAPHDSNAAYQPISRFLRAWLGIGERDVQQDVIGKVEERMQAIDLELDAWRPALLTLLDLPIQDPDWFQLSPPQRKAKVLDLIELLALRRAETQPTILVFEDLHWLDSESQDVLDRFFDLMRIAPIVVLATFRRDFKHNWDDDELYHQIDLAPLQSADSVLLLDKILGTDPSLTDVKERIAKISGGTPLFLEELGKALLASDAIVEKDGASVLAKPIEQFDLPTTVQGVIAAQIDGLPKEQLDILRIAAVIGREVPHEILRHMVQLPEDALRVVCAALEDADFFYRVGLPPEEIYVFKHALVQEVAYGNLLQEQRKALHGLIAERMETFFGDRLEEQVEEAARHAMVGEAWEQAVQYCRLAGLKALSRSAFVDAVKFFDQAASALGNLPVDEYNKRRLLEIRLKQRDALTPIGDSARINECLRDAQFLAEDLDDAKTLAAIHIGKSIIRNFAGDLQSAISEGHAAHRYARIAAEPSLLIGSSYTLGQAYWFNGDFPRAVETLTSGLRQFTDALNTQKFGIGTGSVIHNSTLGVVLAAQGKFTEANAHTREALANATELARPFDIAFASHAVGYSLLQKGLVAEAMPILQNGLKVAEDNAIDLLFPWDACELGLAYGLAGRHHEAKDLLERAVDQSKRIGLRYILVYCSATLAHASLLANDFDAAFNQSQEALSLARELRYRGVEAIALRTLGTCIMRTDAMSVEAKRTLEKAIALTKELKMFPEVALSQLALSHLIDTRGDRTEAKRLRELALETCGNLGMKPWPAGVTAA